MAVEECVDEETPLLQQKPKVPCFGQRHVLTLLSCVGIIAIYCMRVNLSVALVAMINSTAVFEKEQAASNFTAENFCPEDGFKTTSWSDVPSTGEFVWSRKLQGIILSSFFWGGLVLQIPGAMLAHRYGGKWLFGLGILWSSVLTTLIPLATHFHPYVLIGLRVAQGIGEGVVYPALNNLIGLWVPPSEASLLTSLAFEGDAVGVVLGQVISGPLCASAWGWESSFYVCGGLGILWFIPWALLTSDRPECHPCISRGEKLYILKELGFPDIEGTKNPIPYSKILTDTGVWANIIANFSVYWVYFTLVTCLPQYFSDVLHFDIETNGFLAATPHAFCFVMTIVTAHLTDKAIASQRVSRTGIRKLLCFVSFTITAASCFAITYMGCNERGAVILLTVAVGSLGLMGGGLTPNVYDLSPEFSGTIEGFGNTFVTLAGIFTPYVTDSLTRHGLPSQWNIVFYIGSLVAMVGAFLFFFFGSAVRREWTLKTQKGKEHNGLEKGLLNSAVVNTERL